MYHATANNIVALMYHSRKAEVTPEPFRLKRDCYVKIPYEQFIEFVKTNTFPSYLPGLNLQEICMHLNSNSLNAYAIYLKYMAVAQLKELLLAKTRKAKQTTRMLASKKQSKEISLRSILEKPFVRTDRLTRLLGICAKYGFPVDYDLANSDYNTDTFKLASFYYHQSFHCFDADFDYFSVLTP